MRNLDGEMRTAALDGDVDKLDRLLEQGADVKSANRNEDTALHLATYNGHENMVRHLIQRGANTQAQNRNGQTPLQLACVRGFLPILKIFTDIGVDIHTQTGYSAMTGLHLGSKEGYPAICQHLLDCGGDEDLGDFISNIAEYYAANYPTELVFKKWRNVPQSKKQKASDNYAKKNKKMLRDGVLIDAKMIRPRTSIPDERYDSDRGMYNREETLMQNDGVGIDKSPSPSPAFDPYDSDEYKHGNDDSHDDDAGYSDVGNDSDKDDGNDYDKDATRDPYSNSSDADEASVSKNAEPSSTDKHQGGIAQKADTDDNWDSDDDMEEGHNDSRARDPNKRAYDSDEAVDDPSEGDGEGDEARGIRGHQNGNERGRNTYGYQKRDTKKIPRYAPRKETDRERQKFGYTKKGGTWQRLKDHEFEWSDDYKKRQTLKVWERLGGEGKPGVQDNGKGRVDGTKTAREPVSRPQQERQPRSLSVDRSKQDTERNADRYNRAKSLERGRAAMTQEEKDMKRWGYKRGEPHWQKVKDHEFDWSDDFKKRQNMSVFDRLKDASKKAEQAAPSKPAPVANRAKPQDKPVNPFLPKQQAQKSNEDKGFKTSIDAKPRVDTWRRPPKKKVMADVVVEKVAQEPVPQKDKENEAAN